jgi:hypothetical protein
MLLISYIMVDAQTCEVGAPLNLYCMTHGALNTCGGGWILTLGVLCSSGNEEMYISMELYLLNYSNMLPVWWVKILTCLQLEQFLFIIFYNLVSKLLIIFKALVLNPYVHVLCSS